MNHERPSQFKKPTLDDFEAETSGGKGKLTPEQMAGIKFAAQVGKSIQEKFPEIATDYLKEEQEATLSALVTKYSIQSIFKIPNIETAAQAVWFAISGYSGKNSYPGLITNLEELQNAGISHRKEWGKKAGTKLGNLMKDEKRGIFGMSKEKRSIISTKAGIDSYKTKKGIHAQTAEERREASKAGALAREFRLFSDEEKDAMKNLDLSQYMRIKNGVGIDAQKIAMELNDKFHQGINVISPASVSSFFSRKENKKTPNKS